MRESQREAVWTRAAERVVSKHPSVTPELVGNLLADAFRPVPVWEKGVARTRILNERGYARRRLREVIESRLPISLP